MTFDRASRAASLRGRAEAYVRVALECVTREYPNNPWIIATGPGPLPSHRESHPAFYGSFDWHSCVEMHWVIVRLLRRFPNLPNAAIARATLDELLTADNLAGELALFSNPSYRSFERPYGWGWFLTLHHELATWDDLDAARWTEILDPLADLLTDRFVEWLPVLTYPQRTGVHQNTAFGMSRAFDHAQRRFDHEDRRLLDVIVAAARRWFFDDDDYPARYEPSGADFLSAALCEAELVSRIMEPDAFSTWLERFLPGLAEEQPVSLFEPATVSDSTDGQIAHLHGLNLSRAWAFIALAERLPAGDARSFKLLKAAEKHALASLPLVDGSDYMVEHWLAAYATLLLS